MKQRDYANLDENSTMESTRTTSISSTVSASDSKPWAMKAGLVEADI